MPAKRHGFSRLCQPCCSFRRGFCQVDGKTDLGQSASKPNSSVGPVSSPSCLLGDDALQPGNCSFVPLANHQCGELRSNLSDCFDGCACLRCPVREGAVQSYLDFIAQLADSLTCCLSSVILGGTSLLAGALQA